VLHDPKLSVVAGVSSVRATWCSGNVSERVNLLLSSHEQPCDEAADAEARLEQGSRGRRPAAGPCSVPVSGSASTLTRRFESLFLSYAVKIWRKRAVLLGGVPSLDVHGSKLVLSHLLNDGRCRSFAVGARF